MEKYSAFNDPVTGANPYIREIKRRYTLRTLFTTSSLLSVLFFLPFFIFRVMFKKVVSKPKPSAELEKALESGKKTFYCTYTSLFDTNTLFTIFNSPKIFLITEIGIYSISEYNVHRKSSEKEINAARLKGDIVILFLSGGLTNMTALVNVDADIEKHKVDGCIAIKYKPIVTYDIGVFSKPPLPQFTSYKYALFYYLLFFATCKTTKITPSVIFSPSLHGLAQKTGIEIAKETDKSTSYKFLCAFLETEKKQLKNK